MLIKNIENILDLSVLDFSLAWTAAKLCQCYGTQQGGVVDGALACSQRMAIHPIAVYITFSAILMAMWKHTFWFNSELAISAQ